MRQRGTGRMFPRGNILWCQYYSHGEQIRIPCETDKGEKCIVGQDEKKAEKFLRKRLAQVSEGTHADTKHITYENLREAYLLDYKTNKRKSLHTGRDGNVYLDAVRRLDSFFTSYAAKEIDADLIRHFIADQQKQGKSNGTINRSTSALRRMFRLALKDGKLRNVPFFPMLKESAPRSGFFERDEYERLFTALPDYLRPVLAIGYYAGMRRSEVTGLKWDQIDFLNNVIQLRAGETKNGHARTIPIVSQLRELLVQQYQRRHAGCAYVCFRLDRKGHAVKIGGFRKVWQSRCIRLGLGRMEPSVDTVTGETLFGTRTDRPNVKPKVKMVYRGMLYHDLRRSCVRNLVRAGVPEKTAMKISGHLNRQVFDRYNISSGKDVLDAGRKLAAYFDQDLSENGDKTGTTVHQNAAVTSPVQ